MEIYSIFAETEQQAVKYGHLPMQEQALTPVCQIILMIPLPRRCNREDCYCQIITAIACVSEPSDSHILIRDYNKHRQTPELQTSSPQIH